MDLSTTYLGLALKNPIICSSSPLSREVDDVKKLEDAGIAAVVTYSLFEEQIQHESDAMDYYLHYGSESFAEATSYFPTLDVYNNSNLNQYFEHISELKKAVKVPVIGSLNGVSKGGWIEYARNIEEAGADALELNIHYVPTSPDLSGQEVEDMYVDALKAVKETVKIPVAVKVGPYFSSFANFAKRLHEAGADGLVLFNRFYGPDINLEDVELESRLGFSNPSELRLPLRWLAVLRSQLNISLGATSGIHTGFAAAKAILAGADACLITAAILQRGIPYVTTMLKELDQWMAEKQYESVSIMKGSMSYDKVAEPSAYERANYIKILQSYQPE